MRSSLVSPAQLHNVVLLYMSVIDTETGRCEPSERQLAIHLTQQWVPNTPISEVAAVVDTACHAVRSGLRLDPEALAKDLCAAFPLAARHRLVSDLALIARADGHLTQQEAEAIALARCLLLSTPQTVVH